jgi:hypothetical protein
MYAVENRKQHLAPSIAALSVFTCHYQGVSHAAWPEDKYQSASEETICWPLTAATIECAAERLEPPFLVLRCPDYDFVNAPTSSSVEAAETSEVFCWLLRGCHWETASEMILVVADAIRVRFA